MSSISSEPTVQSEVVYDGRVISVRRDTVRLATGTETVREVIEHAPVVAMIAQDENGDLILVRQYRKPVEQALLEIPAGGVESGESLEDAVRREMREETGLRPGRVQSLGTILPSPGISNEVMHLFLTTQLTGDGMPTEATDEIQVERLSLTVALDMITSGELPDAKTVAGILLFERMRWTEKP